MRNKLDSRFCNGRKLEFMKAPHADPKRQSKAVAQQRCITGAQNIEHLFQYIFLELVYDTDISRPQQGGGVLPVGRRNLRPRIVPL